MSEKITARELLVDMEPVADKCGQHVESVGEAALLSIAVSMKRIADLMEGHPQRIGVCDALASIADRMPTSY